MSFRGRGHFSNLSRGRGIHNQRFTPYPARPSNANHEQQPFGQFETPFKQQQQFDQDQLLKQQFDPDQSYRQQQLPSDQLTDQQKNQLYHLVKNNTSIYSILKSYNVLSLVLWRFFYFLGSRVGRCITHPFMRGGSLRAHSLPLFIHKTIYEDLLLKLKSLFFFQNSDFWNTGQPWSTNTNTGYQNYGRYILNEI